MRIEEEALQTLVDSQSLWRTETRHEALLLVGALYRSGEALQDRLVEHILSGPNAPSATQTADRIESLQFEFLNYLEQCQLQVTTKGVEKLNSIREKHPKWTGSKYPGLSHWTETGWVGKKVGGDDVLSLSPEDAVLRLRDAKDSFEYSRRNVAEALGVAIGKDLEWGLRALNSLKSSVHQMEDEQLNPIWWGLRAALTENKNLLTEQGVQLLVEAIQGLIKARPIPELWASVPSFLQTLVENGKTQVNNWHAFGMELAELFSDFDYGRDDQGSDPVEWLDRAINHPYGDLAEMYRDYAASDVTNQVAEKETPVLPGQSRDFFEFTLGNWGKGSRYGACLIAERLSWIEVIDPKFANNQLAPIFDWDSSPEKAEVAWSGFLWGRALSKILTEGFESTYLKTVRNVARLGDDERKGLASHVAAVYWFEPKGLSLIQQFAVAATTEVRVEMISDWKIFLSQAEPSVCTKFANELLFPFWEWCGRQPFFQKSDSERTAFLSLIPFLGELFPVAVLKVQRHAPSSLEHNYMLLQDLRKSSAIGFTKEYIELLTKILELSKNPNWESEEWKEIWKQLESRPEAKLEVLRNVLAKRGVQI